MDDGLAEKLFDAFWASCAGGDFVRLGPWSALRDEQREAWQAVAAMARREAEANEDAEIKMLREANAAWQRLDEEARVDRSGSHVLALAAEHDVITADELPEVLASIEEARNGPASPIGWPDETAAIRASTIMRPYAFQLADGSWAAAHAVEGDDPTPWVTGRGAAALLPDGRIVRLEPSETGLTWKVREEPLPLTETDAAEWRRLAGERADTIARLEGEVERLRADAESTERARAACAEELRRTDAEANGLRQQVEVRIARVNIMVRQLEERGAEVDGWRRKYDAIGEAIEAHLPEHADGELLARIANAGAVIDATAADRDQWRRRHTLAEAGATSLETTLEIRRTDPDEPLDQRLRRVFMYVVHQRCSLAKAERGRDRWKAKAKRLSEGARRGAVGRGGAEGRRAARKGDDARPGHRTGKQR
jgi:hypothetical protein